MRLVPIPAGPSGFAEDKELAKDLRLMRILPALAQGERVVLDFGQVQFATQSFVHALVGEALKRYGEKALDHLEFRSCSAQLRGVVELVVDYSLGGFGPLDSPSRSSAS